MNAELVTLSKSTTEKFPPFHRLCLALSIIGFVESFLCNTHVLHFLLLQPLGKDVENPKDYEPLRLCTLAALGGFIWQAMLLPMKENESLQKEELSDLVKCHFGITISYSLADSAATKEAWTTTKAW